MTLLGIDISSHQPQEDWATLAAKGIAFAFIKATEATDYANPYHAAQVAGARGAGVVAGHYDYAQPDTCTPEAQAAHFLAEVGDIQPGELVALDLEEGSGNLADWALAWLEAVEAATGVRPFLYTYPNFMDTHGLHDARLARFPLWYAAYTYQRDPWPAVPAPWDRITIWQFSDNESIPGVGHVDGDLFDGTRDQLLNYGKLPSLSAEVKPLAPSVPPGARYFPETGQYIATGFKDFWEANPNALRDYGFPLTEEFQTTPLEGEALTIQYFERCRMEWHGDHVELGRIGAELLGK